MLNNKKHKWMIIEAIILTIITASIIAIMLISIIKALFGKQISQAIDLIDMVSITTDSDVVPQIKFDEKQKQIVQVPAYGTRYANIKIDSLGINLPLYYGDKLAILSKGVGHSAGSYFPGEGGSIICMGHNTKAFLYKLPEIGQDAEIKVETTYGTFTYKVYQTKIVNMYHPEELPIQKDEEILMLYTCYPVNGLGHKVDRFVVYAKKI